MSNQDIRWKQRFSNYQKALNQLTKFIEKGELNELEEQGLIQSFEYTHEIAWKTLKDFLKDKGEENLYGSKDTTRLAFKEGLLKNGEVWMDMIKSRNLTSHTYNEEVSTLIVNQIKQFYFNEFCLLQTTLENKD
ncbi:MAG: nucleotidyltransferase [Flavobacteriales bacterium]|nr:MAG: nucleotidyltransferase [Flavobacteriales bacterium]